MKRIVNLMLIISFITYILLFIWVIFLKCNVESWINATYNLFKPMTLKERFLYDIIPFINKSYMRMRSNVYNVFLFIPIPFYIKLLMNNCSDSRIILLGIFISLFVEMLQLFIPFCAFATEDIICNSFGNLVGLLIYNAFFKKYAELENKLLLVCYSFVFLPIVCYAIYNTINNYHIYRF